MTFLSWIDQEKEKTSTPLKYTVITSIALVTLISNKFFLSETHKKFKEIGAWLRKTKGRNRVLIEATTNAGEKLKHLSTAEVKETVEALKGIAHFSSLEDERLDKRWVNLASHMFADLKFVPPQVNKKAMILVPSLAIFTACSWLGLIATVPQGVETILSSSPALQYTLMVIAGIPLIEIGLFMGGSFGYKLSQVGSGARSLSSQLVHPLVRFLGYVPISLVGLGSFATTATLSIQQFKSVPAIAWMLLPSATLGMNLINISSGIELWDEALVAMSTRFNRDKAIFVNHEKFLQDFRKKAKSASSEEVAALIVALAPDTQRTIQQLVPDIREMDLREWVSALREELEKRRLRNQEEGVGV